VPIDSCLSSQQSKLSEDTPVVLQTMIPRAVEGQQLRPQHGALIPFPVLGGATAS
jgi:hypothetical protein